MPTTTNRTAAILSLCLLGLALIVTTLVFPSCASLRSSHTWYRGPSEHKGVVMRTLRDAGPELRRLHPELAMGTFDFKRDVIEVYVAPRKDLPAQFKRGWAEQIGPNLYRIVMPLEDVGDTKGWMHEAGHVIAFKSGYPSSQHHGLFRRYFLQDYR